MPTPMRRERRELQDRVVGCLVVAHHAPHAVIPQHAEGTVRGSGGGREEVAGGGTCATEQGQAGGSRWRREPCDGTLATIGAEKLL